ncbi:MAG: molybdopterin-dependent oxidoreductase, partial [Ilumatobacteraceae bacterium]
DEREPGSPEPRPPDAPAGGPAEVGRGEASVAGVVAAGVALGVGELVCGIAGSGPSLVSAVGTQFIDRYAASLKDLAVSLFGTNDKVALVVGIVAIALALGAVLGRASIRRPWVGVVGFVAFAALGLFSYLDDPLGDASTGVVAAVLSAAAGIGTLLVLLRLARLGGGATSENGPTDRAGSRRTFLLGAGAIAVLGAGAAMLGRRLRTTDVVDRARADTVLPPPASAAPALSGGTGAIPDIVGLSPYITPNDDFYRIDTALVVPQVDVTGWSLGFTGMVDNPFTITYQELVSMSDFEDVVTMQCVSNEVGGNLVGNASWQGVPLATLLDRAGVQQGATQIVGRSVDGFTAGFPTEIGLDGRTALVAIAMNGEPLPATHGFPARLIVAGLYGYVSATKWLDSIELTTWDDFDGYWITRGWSKEGPIKTAARIDVPSSGSLVDPGIRAIAGVAWSPTAGISKVEVQVDDGTWTEATLGEVTSGNTWVQWYVEWEATSGGHRIRARATDADGNLQTEQPHSPPPDGATGWPTRTVRVR